MFREVPIKFRRTTASARLKLNPDERARKLSGICRANAEALEASIRFCSENNIGAFRVNSQILPLKTHPDVGYDLKDLPECWKRLDITVDVEAKAKELAVKKLQAALAG